MQTGRERVSDITSAPRLSRTVGQVEPAPELRSTRASSPRRASTPCNRGGARLTRGAGPRHAGRPLALPGLRQSTPCRHHGPIKSTSRAQTAEQPAVEVRHRFPVCAREEPRPLADSLASDPGVALRREPRLPVREPQECFGKPVGFYRIPAGDARNVAGPGSNSGTGNNAGRPGGNSRDARVRSATHHRTEIMSRCLPAERGALSDQQRPQAGQIRRKSA